MVHFKDRNEEGLLADRVHSTRWSSCPWNT
jgi:hypothetical protein